jgi:hypothetical protein
MKECKKARSQQLLQENLETRQNVSCPSATARHQPHRAGQGLQEQRPRTGRMQQRYDAISPTAGIFTLLYENNS